MKNELSEFLTLLCAGMFIISFWSAVLATSVVLSSWNSQPPVPSQRGKEWQPPQQTSYQKTGEADSREVIGVAAETSIAERERSSGNTQHETKDKSSNWSDPIVWFTAGLLLVASIQACIYHGQSRIMRQTLTTAHRPYVWTKIEQFSRFNESIAPTFVFRLIHSGETPAKDIEFRAILFVKRAGENVLPHISNPWNPKLGNLFPRDSSYGTITCEPKQFFSKEEINQIRSKTHYLCVGLELQYWDVFNQGHTTRVYQTIVADAEALGRLTSNEKGPCDLQFITVPGGSSFT